MQINCETVYFFQQDTPFIFPRTIDILGFSLSLYGVCLALGVFLGILYSFWKAKQKKLDLNHFLTVQILVIIFGFVGARLGYVLFHWEEFSDNPFLVFLPRTGGLCFYGALLGAWLVFSRLENKSGAQIRKSADILSHAAMLSGIPIWLGCLLNQEPVGKFTKGPLYFAVEADNVLNRYDYASIEKIYRHAIILNDEIYVKVYPVALIGLVLSIVGFFVLSFLASGQKKDGFVFCVYLVYQGALQLLLSLISANRCTAFGITVPIVFLISLCVIVAVPVYATKVMFPKKQKFKMRTYDDENKNKPKNNEAQQ